jgi:hypothetical protein
MAVNGWWLRTVEAQMSACDICLYYTTTLEAA